MKKAVLFDLDGTLANTITSIAHCANQALNRFGLPSFTEEEYKLFVGNGADVLIRRALAAAGDREMVHFDEAYEEYRRLFREGCMYQVRPYEGIVPLLERLKESGAKIAVLSNKPHENSVYVVESLFGKGYFDCVCGRKAVSYTHLAIGRGIGILRVCAFRTDGVSRQSGAQIGGRC